MNIYVFQRADGSEWSDFRVPEDAKVLRTFSVKQALREKGRVKALAERALTETPMAEVEAPVRALAASREPRGGVKSWIRGVFGG